MKAAERLADAAGFKARRAEAARRGKLRGIGVCGCIEVAGGPLNCLLPDIARVSLLANGHLRVHIGEHVGGSGL